MLKWHAHLKIYVYTYVMYSLKFIHPKGTSRLTWDLDAEGEDCVSFINGNGTVAKKFRLNVCSELLTIWLGSSCLLELSFLDSNLLYILRLLKDGEVIREFYLGEDELDDDKQFVIQYPADA